MNETKPRGVIPFPSEIGKKTSCYLIHNIKKIKSKIYHLKV